MTSNFNHNITAHLRCASLLDTGTPHGSWRFRVGLRITTPLRSLPNHPSRCTVLPHDVPRSGNVIINPTQPASKMVAVWGENTNEKNS